MTNIFYLAGRISKSRRHIPFVSLRGKGNVFKLTLVFTPQLCSDNVSKGVDIFLLEIKPTAGDVHRWVDKYPSKE